MKAFYQIKQTLPCSNQKSAVTMEKTKTKSFIKVMRLLLLLLQAPILLLAQTPPPLPQLATGANENVFASVQETYYVDPTGDDNNSGTSLEPFKTFAKGVSKAVERKNANVSVRIIIRDGVYREKAGILPSGTEVTDDTEAAIIIEAQNTGQAIISGSEDWSGQWTQQGNNWQRDWPFDWGVAPGYAQVNNELGRRREIFFVNKVLYKQVLSQSELTDGTYYVDETGDKVYIRPLSDVNMSTALIEVGIREKLFTINANRRNIAIKGLVFQHDASFPTGGGANEGALRVGKDCSNLLIEDVSIELNNGAGLGTFDKSDYRQDVTFRRVKVNHNGGGGFIFGNSQNLLFEDCETSYNRFRSAWAGQIQGAGPGGFKLASTHRTTFIRHQAVGNYGRGMWWDIANRDMTAKNCYVEGNYGSGIFVEYNFGPALIENCTILNTQKSNNYTVRNQGGLQFASTANLTIRNCTIKNNIQSQIKCWDQQRTMTDHLTGEEKRYDSTNVGNIYLRNNEVACLDSSQSLIDLPDWTYLKNTFNSDSNTYQHPAREDAFRVYQGGTEDGDNASDANYFIATYYTFAEWKQYIDGDANSTFGEVSGSEEISVVLPDSIGAYIDESSIQAHYYVSPTGLNTNTGTSPEEALANPFVAIERANANSLAQGFITKIHIANGTYTIPRKEYDYRDSAIAPAAKSTTLIIEGETYRSVILNGNNTGRLNLKGKSNLVMRNLVFTNCGGEAAFKAEEFYGNGAAVPQPQSRNWRIEYCAFNNNKLRGLRILHVDHLTMEHCEVKDNLDDGFQYIGRESHLNDILVSGNDKPDANQNDFGNGGFNFSSKRSLVENMTVRDNRGAGFRGDFQNEDVIVRNCIFEDNQGGGVTVEVTFGPILFLTRL